MVQKEKNIRKKGMIFIVLVEFQGQYIKKEKQSLENIF